MPAPDLQMIGKYEILAELGQGGFGRVYRAFDPTVGRPVAIKILTAEGNRDLLTRFRNEATAAGNLRHRNIVTVYDYGEYNGRPYLVMELLEGEDLTHVISNHAPLSLLQKMNIMDQVAAGLDCAHQNGVLHRDVKPANIRILPDGTVKIMDFGIARVNSDRNATRLTQQGDLIGTILYMSPEQFSGSEADALCDIFAYGVIYFELLTGKHPFRSSDPRSVMFKITMEDPESVRTLVPDCPEGLDRILSRALHKDRELRYQNLRDLQLDAEPLIFELKQAKARELVEEAIELYGVRESQKALLLINEALNLDPSNRDARQLRENVQRRIQKEALQPRIDLLMQSAQEQLEKRSFIQAVQSLESALKLDQTNDHIRGSLETAREQMKRAKEAALLAAAALSHLGRKEWLAASGKSVEAERIDPFNKDVARVRDEIAKHVAQVLSKIDSQIEDDDLLDSAIRELNDLATLQPESPEIHRRFAAARLRQDARARVQAAIEAAQQRMDRAQLDEALQEIDRELAAWPNERKLTRLRDTIVAAKAARERDLLVRRTILDAGLRRDESRFDDALAIVGEGLAKYPDERLLLDLKSRLRAEWDFERQAAVLRAQAEARQCLENQHFDGAIQCLEDALKSWPGESVLEDLLRTTRSALSERQHRAAVISKALEDGGTLLAQGHPARAVEVLTAASIPYPDEHELQNLLQQAQTALRSVRRREAVEKALAEVQRKSEQEDFSGAIDVIEIALGAWPGEDALVEALHRTREAQSHWERQRAVGRAVQEGRDLARAHRYADALKIVQAGLKEHPNETALSELHRELQRAESVRRALEDGKKLLQQGRAEEAIGILMSASGQYPDEERLRVQLAEAQQALAAQQRAEAVRRASENSKKLLQQGRAEEAIHILLLASGQYPDDEPLRQLLAAAQRTLASQRRHEAVEKAVAAARQQNSREDFTGAIATLEQALKSWPGEDPLVDLLQKTREAQSHWERQRTVNSVAQKSQELARAHRYPDALNELQAGLKQYPDEPVLLELRREVQRCEGVEKAVAAARQQGERENFAGAIATLEQALKSWPGEDPLVDLLQKTRVSSVVQKSQELARAHRYPDALNELQAGLKQYPDEPALLELLRELQRREGVEKAVAAARQQGEREDFAGAIATLEQALKSWPGEDPLLDLLQKTREAQILWERRRAVQEVVQRAERFTAQNQRASALDAVQAGLKNYAGEPELLAIQKQLQDHLEDERRSAAVDQIVKSARQLLEQRQSKQAVEVLTEACRQYADEPRLMQMLGHAQETLRVEQRREPVEKALAEAQRRAAQRDFTGAIETLTNALKTWPGETRLSDLLKNTQKARDQWERAEVIREVVRQTKQLAAGNRFADALQTVQAAMRKHGLDPLLVELQQQIEAQITSQQTEPMAGQPIPLTPIGPPSTGPPVAIPPAAFSRNYLLLGGIAAVALLAGVAGPRLFRGDSSVSLLMESNVNGASVRVGGQSCVLPDCALKLPAGTYRLVASKDGFSPLEQPLSLKAGSRDIKIPLMFKALPQLLQVNTNFASGQVLLDGVAAGELRDGQFRLDRVVSGTHTIRVTGGDAQFEAQWRGEPGEVPVLTRPIAAKNVQATLFANAGRSGSLACNCDVRGIQVDGSAVTSAEVAGGLSLAVKNLNEGSRRITVSDRSLVVDVRPNPALNIFLSLDRNVGTLVVEAGQDNATVFLNNRPYRRLTERGILRVPVEVGEYTVRVVKPGFRPSAESKLQVGKGEEKQVSFALTQLPASLEINGALPGALVKLDGKPVGQTSPNGTLRTEVTPGDHQIEITRDDYTPVRFGARFAPGEAIRPQREQIAMARVIPPPTRPDPRQIEAQDWEKVRNSNSIDELDDFVRKHPGGAYIDGARTRIAQLRQQIQADAARQAEQTAWDSLDKSRKAAIQDFLSRYGSGPHQQDARALITEMEKREADALAAARAAAEQQRLSEAKAKDQEQAGRVLADQQSITRVLDQYEKAYNAKDLRSLQGIWRGMPKTVSDPLGAQFRYAKSMAFQMRPAAPPVVNGDTATVTCTRSLDLTTPDNQKVNSGNERVRVTLDRAGAVWVIRSIATL
jgi:eukaryotic-like serine/threonine-protein kinase